MSEKELEDIVVSKEVPLYRSNLFKVTMGILIMVVVFSVLYYPFRDSGMNDFGAKLSSMIIGMMAAVIVIRIKGIFSKSQSSGAKKKDSSDPKLVVSENIKRLESQRDRLSEQLGNGSDSQEKLELEKMILDIDSRILKTQLQIVSEYEKNHPGMAKLIRKNIGPRRIISAGVRKGAPAARLVKDNIHPERLVSGDMVKSVQSKSQQKLRGLLKKR